MTIAAQRGNVEMRDTSKDTISRWEKLKVLAGNKYLYPFVLGWASLHVGMGGCFLLGIVAKKSGYDAVTANLLTTVSH